MKKISAFCLIFILCLTTFNLAAGDSENLPVTLYAPDGRTIEVNVAEVEAYKAVGWFETYEEVVKTLYAPDGRTVTVYLAQVDAFKQVGWFETYADVTRTLYAPDGRTIVVYLAEVEAYHQVGWYDRYEDVTRTLYAPDGRTIVVYLSEVPAYLNVGWYTCNPNQKMVALTFDDGPSYYTDTILDALSAHGAKATFFVLGQRVPTYVNQLRRAADLGMEIGNHTQNHKSLTSLSLNGAINELATCDHTVANIISASPSMFRPPYGNCNRQITSGYGKPSIMWSLDTLDWKTRNADSTVNAVLNQVKDGDIILMHDIYKPTADAVVRLIPELQKRGFELVTVSELAKAKGDGLSPGATYYHFR